MIGNGSCAPSPGSTLNFWGLGLRAFRAEGFQGLGRLGFFWGVGLVGFLR